MRNRFAGSECAVCLQSAPVNLNRLIGEIFVTAQVNYGSVSEERGQFLGGLSENWSRRGKM